MRKYLKPPFPRYHPPYPVLYAKVPLRNRRQRSQKLYGARLINSPYMYDDPYTTVAVNDPYAQPKRRGSKNNPIETKDVILGAFFGIIICSMFKK